MNKKILSLLLFIFVVMNCYSQRKYIQFVNENKVGLLDENLNVVLKPSKSFIYDYGDFLITQEYPATSKILNSELEVLYTVFATQNCFIVSKDYCLFDSNSGSFLVNTYTGEAVRSNLGFRKLGYRWLVPNGNVIAGVNNYFSVTDFEEGYLSGKKQWNTYPFMDGRAVIMVDDMKFSIIDEDFKVIRDDIVNCSEIYSDGLLAVKTSDGKTGFIDKSGNYVFETDFYLGFMDYNPRVKPELNAYFNEGYVCVQSKMNQWKIFDKSGKTTVLNSEYRINNPVVHDGLICVSKTMDGNRLYGYVNTKGTEVIPCVLDSASDFKNGYAVISLDGKFGIIDKSGNIYYSQDLIKGIKSPSKIK